MNPRRSRSVSRGRQPRIESAPNGAQSARGFMRPVSNDNPTEYVTRTSARICPGSRLNPRTRYRSQPTFFFFFPVERTGRRAGEWRVVVPRHILGGFREPFFGTALSDRYRALVVTGPEKKGASEKRKCHDVEPVLRSRASPFVSGTHLRPHPHGSSFIRQPDLLLRRRGCSCVGRRLQIRARSRGLCPRV